MIKLFFEMLITLYKHKMYKIYLYLHKKRENYIYTYIFVLLSFLSRISLATLPDVARSLASLALYKQTKCIKCAMFVYIYRKLYV